MIEIKLQGITEKQMRLVDVEKSNYVNQQIVVNISKKAGSALPFFVCVCVLKCII